MKIGEKLKTALASRGMTQVDLAKKTNLTEVSISRYLADTRIPKADTIKVLCKALNITADWLLEIGLEDIQVGDELIYPDKNNKLSFYGVVTEDQPNKKLYYSPAGKLLKYEVNTFKGVYPYKTLSYDIYGRLININLVNPVKSL